jgi:hypothetical protein
VPRGPATQDPGTPALDRALILETLHRLAIAWSQNNSYVTEQCFTDNASMTVTQAGEKSLGTYQSSDAIVSALTSELQIQDGRQRVIFNSPFIDDLEDGTVLITAIFLVHSFRSAPPALIATGIARAHTMQPPDRPWRITKLVLGFDTALRQ